MVKTGIIEKKNNSSLSEVAVHSVEWQYSPYVAKVPLFQQYASNARDMFGDRRLFTKKTLDTACGSNALVLVSDTGRRGKLISMERCNNRFCPLCSYIEHKKDTNRVRYILHQSSLAEGTALLGFGFSFPNCSGEDLNSDIKRLNKAFHVLVQRWKFEGYYLGHFRKLEVTYNNDPDDPAYGTYHPHLHVLLHIDKSKYFGTDYFRNPQEWLSVWHAVSKQTATTNIFLKAYDPDRNTLSNAFIKEFSHYAVKPDDLLISQEVFNYLVSALKNKQAYTLGGTLMEYAAAFDASPVVVKLNDALTEYSDREIYVYSHIALLEYDYSQDHYICADISELPRSILGSDANFKRLFRCSHLLSFDLFLDHGIMEGFFQGLDLDECLKLDFLKRFIAS